jgi:hypothetical protein
MDVDSGCRLFRKYGRLIVLPDPGKTEGRHGHEKKQLIQPPEG